ncbi:MAG: Sec-independent protein translocase protein TatB [Egibacteraceae bacterium]
MHLSFFEMLQLAVLALVIFGPERLPEVARNAGRTVARLRREANNTLDEFRHSADLADLRELRNELREVTADLKQHSPLTGPMAMGGFGVPSPLWRSERALRSPLTDPGVLPTTFEPLRLRPPGAPPFDPDAT